MRPSTSLRLLVGCVLATPLLATAAPGLAFSHHDWELACDNTGTCRAAGYQRDDDESPVSVLLTRPAGPAAAVEGRLRLGDADDRGPAPAKVELRVAGQALGPVAIDEESSEGALRPAQVAALLKAAAGDGEVVFRAGSREWHLSGDGATAVLLKMDEAQGRLGTTSALVKKGRADDTKIAGTVPAPVVVAVHAVATRPDDAALAERVRPQLKAPGDDCPGEPGAAPELHVWRLDVGHVLVSQLCWRAAYNEGYGFWVANDRPPFAPRLVTANGQDFDGKDSIGAYQKGRGIGDCIGTDEWVWNGHDFVHTASSTSGLCKGVAAGGAWALPTLVSDVRRGRR